MFRSNFNFFSEGGRSILAQQMVFKEWKDISLPIKVTFQFQSLEALAAEVDRAPCPIGRRLDAMAPDADNNIKDEAYATDARDLTNKIPNLCATGKVWRLAFVSSTSTLDTDHCVELSKNAGVVMKADDLEGSRKGPTTGYRQSKWASELLVREARLRGLAGAIIHPGYITADPVPVSRLLTTFCSDHGRDHCGRGIGHQPPTLVAYDWIGALGVYGYEASVMHYPWCSVKVKQYVSDTTEEEPYALLPLFHFVVGGLPGNSIAPELDDADTLGH
ncbi:hypothetical protein GGI43DRAFT_385665 [Trichoderma evansii]